MRWCSIHDTPQDTNNTTYVNDTDYSGSILATDLLDGFKEGLDDISSESSPSEPTVDVDNDMYNPFPCNENITEKSSYAPY